MLNFDSQIDLHAGIVWVQGCKEDCPYFMEEDTQARPEGSCHLPKVTWLTRAGLGISARLRFSPAACLQQGQGCPSAREESSGLLKADLSQGSAVSPSRSTVRGDGGRCPSMASGPCHYAPAGHRESLPPSPPPGPSAGPLELGVILPLSETLQVWGSRRESHGARQSR